MPALGMGCLQSVNPFHGPSHSLPPAPLDAAQAADGPPGSGVEAAACRHECQTRTILFFRACNDVLEARLRPCETNPSRPGSNLWSPGASLAPAGRSALSGSSNGRDPLGARYSLASRRRRARPDSHPRAVCISSEALARKRGHRDRRISRQSSPARLDTSAQARLETHAKRCPQKEVSSPAPAGLCYR